METFDPRKLESDFADQGEWKKLAFMASCCERMMPNYRAFSRETGWGDEDVLRRALNVAWDAIATDSIPPGFQHLVHLCDQQSPDTEDFSSEYTSAALDAASAIAILLEGVGKRSGAALVEVASFARDSIDMMVRYRLDFLVETPDLDERVACSDAMQLELRAQRRDMEILLRTQERPVVIAILRAVSK